VLALVITSSFSILAKHGKTMLIYLLISLKVFVLNSHFTTMTRVYDGDELKRVNFNFREREREGEKRRRIKESHKITVNNK
jgi:hypothetical protein